MRTVLRSYCLLCYLFLYRSVKRHATWAKAMLDVKSQRVIYLASRKYSVLLLCVRIVVLPSHARQAATRCFAETVRNRFVMPVARHQVKVIQGICFLWCLLVKCDLSSILLHSYSLDNQFGTNAPVNNAKSIGRSWDWRWRWMMLSGTCRKSWNWHCPERIRARVAASRISR